MDTLRSSAASPCSLRSRSYRHPPVPCFYRFFVILKKACASAVITNVMRSHLCIANHALYSMCRKSFAIIHYDYCLSTTKRTRFQFSFAHSVTSSFPPFQSLRELNLITVKFCHPLYCFFKIPHDPFQLIAQSRAVPVVGCATLAKSSAKLFGCVSVVFFDFLCGHSVTSLLVWSNIRSQALLCLHLTVHSLFM